MQSIRAKFILAFLLVIVVCLLPTSIASAFVLRKYQQRDALDGLENVAQSATVALASRPFLSQQIVQSQAELNAILDEQARATNTRVVILDPHGLVLADTGGKLSGQIWLLPNDPSGDMRAPNIRKTYKGQAIAPDGENVAAVAYRLDRKLPSPPLQRGQGQGPGQGNNGNGYGYEFLPQGTQIVVLTPWSAVGSGWRVIAGQLQVVVVIALGVALLLAFVLSRSLTSRLRTLTEGAHAMANGDYASALRLATVQRGADEVGELADAFKTMAVSVSRAQQAQRDLVANVSHELKTPLTSIQGFSHALMDGTVSNETEAHELAEIIAQESARMQRLVEQMLELSRLEAGTVPLDLVPIHANEFVENIGRRYARLAEARGVSVRWNGVPVLLYADAGRLEQVLVNLLDNALQYTPDGGEITLHAQNGRHGVVQFVVRDTGKGIPAADISRLFERFYQVDRARSEHGRHVGLGLAIVREIVDAHRGTISVESDVGIGTTVTVSVPVGQPALWADERPALEPRVFDRRAVIGG